MNDRDVHYTYYGQHRARTVGALRVVYRGTQAHISKVQEQQDQLGSQARIPLPVGAPHAVAPQGAGDQRHKGERGADRRATGRHRMRNLDAPDQSNTGRHRHGRVDHERHPCGRNVNIHDAEIVALLIVRRCEHQASIQAACDQRGSQPREPRRQAGREPINIGRRAEPMKPGPGHFHSRLMRTAAAAASGARVMPRTASAPSRYSGGANPAPFIARSVARAPNINTGIDNGSVNKDSSAPLRFTPRVNAAPIDPIKLNATLPIATETTMPLSAATGTPSDSAASGAITASGSPVSSQCATVLANSSHVNDWPDNTCCSSVPSCASSRNRNSSASREDNKAATHNTPGATSRSRDNSGEMPSGNNVVTMAKNASG